MAKVIITIEDLPGDRVKATCDPTIETLIKSKVSGNFITSAQAYAVYALNHIRKESKRRSPIPFLIPKIGN